MNWIKSIALSVNCPYCGTGYTFSRVELRDKWRKDGGKAPLHPACKKAAKEVEGLGGLQK